MFDDLKRRRLKRSLEEEIAKEPSAVLLYELLDDHATDNEYLYYINHKLGYANHLLQHIRLYLMIIVLMLGSLLIGAWRADFF